MHGLQKRLQIGMMNTMHDKPHDSTSQQDAPDKSSLRHAQTPVIGFVAPSGTGKTTLLSQIVRLLSAQGLRIGVVKQARDDFDVDIPGKDSYELRKAGLDSIIIGSERKSAQIDEHPDGRDPNLDELLLHFDQEALDLILVEGFTEQRFPKIELQRGENLKTRYPLDPDVIALATDRLAQTHASIPIFDINNPKAVAEFLLTRLMPDTLSGETTS